MTLEELKILIVEDDPIISLDIKSILQYENITVVGIAKTATRALDLLHNFKPNFVILDIHLGTGGSGIDVAEVIHKKYNIPYIFLTSYSDTDTLLMAQEQSPYGYLVKPYQDKTLITTITTAWHNYNKIISSKTINIVSIAPQLTEQEVNICEELIRGLSYQQICESLFISINTLKYHVKNIYTKMDVKGRSELTALLTSSS